MLAEIAGGDDPAALLARRLILLEEGGDASRQLLEDARAALDPTASRPVWARAGDHRSDVDPLSDEALRDTLLRAGMHALEAMLAQSGERALS